MRNLVKLIRYLFFALYLYFSFRKYTDTSVAVMRTLGNRLRFILQTGLHRGRDRGQIYNKEAFVQEVAANIIRTVSNLMSENKSMAWLDLKVPLRMKLINHLLLALEEVAFMLAEVTETPEFLEEVAENLGKYSIFFRFRPVIPGAKFRNFYVKPHDQVIYALNFEL